MTIPRNVNARSFLFEWLSASVSLSPIPFAVFVEKMKDRKTVMQTVLNQLRNIFPQVAVDHLKNIIAGSVGSQVR